MKKADAKTHLPLLQILKEMKGYQRQIVVDHLNPKATRCLKNCITLVLKKKPKNKKAVTNQTLKKHIQQNQQAFKHLLSSNGKNTNRMLARVGGNPLATILSTAIPLLMSLF